MYPKRKMEVKLRLHHEATSVLIYRAKWITHSVTWPHMRWWLRVSFECYVGPTSLLVSLRRFNSWRTKWAPAHRNSVTEWCQIQKLTVIFLVRKKIEVNFFLESLKKGENFRNWRFLDGNQCDNPLLTQPLSCRTRIILFFLRNVGQHARLIWRKMREISWKYSICPTDVIYKIVHFLWKIRTKNSRMTSLRFPFILADRPRTIHCDAIVPLMLTYLFHNFWTMRLEYVSV